MTSYVRADAGTLPFRGAQWRRSPRARRFGVLSRSPLPPAVKQASQPPSDEAVVRAGVFARRASSVEPVEPVGSKFDEHGSRHVILPAGGSEEVRPARQSLGGEVERVGSTCAERPFVDGAYSTPDGVEEADLHVSAPVEGEPESCGDAHRIGGGLGSCPLSSSGTSLPSGGRSGRRIRR